MKETYLLTLTICSYHRAEYLVRTLKQVLNLQSTRIEFLLFIDDPEYDSCLEKIEPIINNDERVTVITNQERSGFIESYMKSLELASGKYVMPVSDEDQVDIETINSLLPEMENGEVNAFFGYASWFNEKEFGKSPSLWSRRKPGYYVKTLDAFSIDYLPYHVHYSGYILKKELINFKKLSTMNYNGVGHYWQQVPTIISVTRNGYVKVLDSFFIYCSNDAEKKFSKTHNDTIMGGDGYSHPIAWVNSILWFKKFTQELIADDKIIEKCYINLVKTYFLRQCALFESINYSHKRISKKGFIHHMEKLKNDEDLSKAFEKYYIVFEERLFNGWKNSNSFHIKLKKKLKEINVKLFGSNFQQYITFLRHDLKDNIREINNHSVKYTDKNKIKVLHFNTADIKGGAALGTYFLFTEQKQNNELETFLCVRDKYSEDNDVFTINRKMGVRSILNVRNNVSLMPIYYRNIRTEKGVPFKPDWGKNPLIKKIKRNSIVKKSDILHMHWICWGFIRPKDLSGIKKPIVWTMRDMWPFTGGCHFSEGCNNYKNNCENCHYIISGKENGITEKSLNSKKESWKNLDLHLVAPSQWIADCAKESSVFSGKDIHVIPNGIDTNEFISFDMLESRKELEIPEDEFVISIGAVNTFYEKRKGFDILIEALDILNKEKDINPYILVFGGDGKTIPEQLKNRKHKYFGYVSDKKRLSKIYSASNAFVAPYREESFGKTLVESLSCNTPVVSFDASGQKDLVLHKKTGYKAAPYESSDIANGILYLMNNTDIKTSGLCREDVIKKYDIKVVEQEYRKLYKSILRG